mmetsp:Transcript_37126/g.79937  ORF Transcript_37126/g.79937 Transcript_37126/m.79937 type:complete len:222 (-) Transcript_37126:1126-1791(-)
MRAQNLPAIASRFRFFICQSISSCSTTSCSCLLRRRLSTRPDFRILLISVRRVPGPAVEGLSFSFSFSFSTFLALEEALGPASSSRFRGGITFGARFSFRFPKPEATKFAEPPAVSVKPARNLLRFGLDTGRQRRMRVTTFSGSRRFAVCLVSFRASLLGPRCWARCMTSCQYFSSSSRPKTSAVGCWQPNIRPVNFMSSSNVAVSSGHFSLNSAVDADGT